MTTPPLREKIYVLMDIPCSFVSCVWRACISALDCTVGPSGDAFVFIPGKNCHLAPCTHAEELPCPCCTPRCPCSEGPYDYGSDVCAHARTHTHTHTRTHTHTHKHTHTRTHAHTHASRGKGMKQRPIPQSGHTAQQGVLVTGRRSPNTSSGHTGQRRCFEAGRRKTHAHTCCEPRDKDRAKKSG